MNDVPTKGTPPYLFIDVDGVLNSRASCVAHGGPGHPHNPTKMDTVAVSLVQKLVDKLDMNVVVSSSWRGGGPARFAAWMVNYGWLDCPVVGETRQRTRTPSGWGSTEESRGDLIKEWLEKNAPKALKERRYVIVDDDKDAADGHPVECFRKTSFEEGFRYGDYRKCIKKIRCSDL
jgi:hypothetical protein